MTDLIQICRELRSYVNRTESTALQGPVEKIDAIPDEISVDGRTIRDVGFGQTGRVYLYDDEGLVRKVKPSEYRRGGGLSG